MQTELKMQDVFDLNTTIDRLKYALEQGYNFESKSHQLQTNITIFARDNAFDLDVQNRYAKLNEDFKQLVKDMISELEVKRDAILIRIMSKPSESDGLNDDSVEN